MKTMAISCLPRPPDIIRAQCPEAKPINYLSDYLWKLNNMLFLTFSWIYADLVDYQSTVLTIYDTVGTFTVGQTLTGETSGATGEIITVSVGSLTLKFVVGTFSDDEKVTCVASDAYAFTTESVWASPMEIGLQGPYIILKQGESAVSFDDSWDKYDAASVTGGEGVAGSNFVPRWGTSTTVWTSEGVEGGLYFDTTDAPVGATTITLNIDIDIITNTFGNPILKIYKLDEALDTSHWLAGGTPVATEELTATGVHSYPLTYSDINQGGISRFRLSFTKLEAQTKPTEVVRQQIHFDIPVYDNTYLEFVR